MRNLYQIIRLKLISTKLSIHLAYLNLRQRHIYRRIETLKAKIAIAKQELGRKE